MQVKKRRRKWPWVLLALVVFFIIVGALSGGNEDDKRESSPAPSTTGSASPPLTGPTPKYSVVGQLQWRSDGEPTYYVVIDPVDLSNDGFKQTVKLVTQALAQQNGGVDFSAKFYDDQSVAKEALASDPGSGNHTVPDKASLDFLGQHLVGIYSGGIEVNPSPYQLAWYPGAFTNTPNVGRWVGYEDWKPSA